MVTELGRQPWVIYHIMRTKDAVTSLPNLSISLVVMTGVYCVLGIIVVWLLGRHVIASPETALLEHTEAHV
jgi:cytochrome bd ubiquinol oxidase subunit I